VGTVALEEGLRDSLTADILLFRAGEGTGEGIFRITLSCSKTKDSLGNGDDRWACLPWARGDRDELFFDEFPFCHADLTDDGVGKCANFSASEVYFVWPDGEGGREAVIMSYAEGARSPSDASSCRGSLHC
jgi:hypothetical protein